MVTIVVDQFLSESSLHEHICLENIKKLYKSAGKCDDQQKYKAITEAAMVSTPEGITDNTPMAVGASGTLNNPISRNSLGKFSALLDVKQKNSI